MNWIEKDKSPAFIDLWGYEDGMEHPSYKAHLKFDGCVDLWRFNSSRPEESPEYTHVCGGFADLIEVFRVLTSRALEHFDEVAEAHHWRPFRESSHNCPEKTALEDAEEERGKANCLNDSLQKLLREVGVVWRDTWDCSRHPGHAGMDNVLEKVDKFLWDLYCHEQLPPEGEPCGNKLPCPEHPTH